MSDATKKAPLEDVMAAMDVVDTLRHQQGVAERELDSQARRKRMLQRLKDMYQAQGIEVPERVLLEGIDALEQERFRYQPVATSWRTRLAHIWVSRSRWGKPMVFLAGVAGALWVVYFALEVYPQWKAHNELPESISQNLALTQQRAKNQDIVAQAKRLSSIAKQSIANGDLSQARSNLQSMQDINLRLSLAYSVRVVSRPNENSGVWRVPPGNSAARNYYLIVEAIDANNRVLEIPVLNEENNRLVRKKTWGLRVDQQTFNKIASDKQDDGIIQGNKIGVKRVGFLQPEFNVPTTGATITEW